MPTSAPPKRLIIDCPAKLNLTLAVGPPRADGLHPIASVMTAIDFADTLYLEPCSIGTSTFKRSWSEYAPKPHPIDWPIESDLAFRAHELIEAEVGRRLPIECRLTKRIPAGAGLGGGSSNAASMLVGLRMLFSLDLTDERLIELGASLGADVGFLVHAQFGRTAAVVTGIGEQIDTLSGLPAFHAVLVFPDGACPTGAVYAAFDALGQATSTTRLDELARSWRFLAALAAPFNDLDAAAEIVCPPIRSAIATLSAWDLTPHLTGSGSALFILAGGRPEAEAIAQRAIDSGIQARVCAYNPS